MTTEPLTHIAMSPVLFYGQGEEIFPLSDPVKGRTTRKLSEYGIWAAAFCLFLLPEGKEVSVLQIE